MGRRVQLWCGVAGVLLLCIMLIALAYRGIPRNQSPAVTDDRTSQSGETPQNAPRSDTRPEAGVQFGPQPVVITSPNRTAGEWTKNSYEDYETRTWAMRGVGLRSSVPIVEFRFRNRTNAGNSEFLAAGIQFQPFWDGRTIHHRQSEASGQRFIWQVDSTYVKGATAASFPLLESEDPDIRHTPSCLYLGTEYVVSVDRVGENSLSQRSSTRIYLPDHVKDGQTLVYDLFLDSKVEMYPDKRPLLTVEVADQYKDQIQFCTYWPESQDVPSSIPMSDGRAEKRVRSLGGRLIIWKESSPGVTVAAFAVDKVVDNVINVPDDVYPINSQEGFAEVQIKLLGVVDPAVRNVIADSDIGICTERSWISSVSWTRSGPTLEFTTQAPVGDSFLRIPTPSGTQWIKISVDSQTRRLEVTLDHQE